MTLTAVAAVAVLWDQSTDRVLLIRRPQRAGDPWAGHWALPGGKREATDADLLATAIRETHEECAIALQRDQAHPLPLTMAGRAVGSPLHVAPFAFRLSSEPAITPQPAEVASWHWLALSRLRDRDQHQRGPVRPGHDDEQWPHMVVDGHPLWGFTYQVLCEYFLEL